MFVEDLGDRVIFSLKPHCIEETGPEIPDSLVDASFYAMLLLLRRAPGNEKFYRMRRKTPPFRAGDIRRVRRICVSN